MNSVAGNDRQVADTDASPGDTYDRTRFEVVCHSRQVGREQDGLVVRRKPVRGPEEDDWGPGRTAAGGEHLAEVAVGGDDHQIVGGSVVSRMLRSDAVSRPTSPT